MNSRIMKLLVLLWALLMPTQHGVQAQSDGLDAPWPIIQRCISLEGTPPLDWSFKGTLLLSSGNELHVYRQDWPTPRIVASYSGPLDTALSPDGHWFAVVKGRDNGSTMLVTFLATTEIQVFSTSDTTVYSISWDNAYGGIHRIYGHRLYWIDNRHLLYSKGDMDERWFIIDPFTAEIIPWNRSFTPTHFVFELAPDAQKGLSAEWGDSVWTIVRGESSVETSSETSYNAVWHPSSEYFVTLSKRWPSSTTDSLLMFDLNGEIKYHLYRTRPDSRNTLQPDLVWSRDGRYLAFVDAHLYIADLDTQQVIDTCLVPEGYFTFAWSPTANQLAVVDPRSSDSAIRVVDFEQSGSYVVGYHQGEIIGWRAEDGG